MNIHRYFGLFLALLLVFLSPAEGNSQVVVIGHVTAEVVESVSASAKVVTGFDIRNTTRGAGGASASELNMGTMTVHTGKDVACNVVLEPAVLTDMQGNGFTIDPNLTAQKQNDGTRTLNIRGTARTEKGQASGMYRGTYTMVFAYN